MARKSSGRPAVVVGALVVLVLLVQAIQEYWPVFLVFGGIALAFLMFFKKPASRRSARQQKGTAATRASVDLSTGVAERDYSHRASKPRVQDGDKLWLPEGKTITVAGYLLNGGFLYVGKGLAGGGDGWSVEAALINPSLPVDREDDDYTIRKLGYWPSYSQASEDARASYLNWLARGRSDPK